MIEKIIFDKDVLNLDNLWYDSSQDSGVLVACADYAVQNSVNLVSVLPSDVSILWPWLENSGIKIFTRFYINDDSDVSQIFGDITKSFKSGANGAQIFLDNHRLKNFADSVTSVRDDLFFDKEFNIGIDVLKIDFSEWKILFDCLKNLRCDGLVLTLSNDTGDKSDFVGHIMSMFELWPDDFKAKLYLNFDDNLMRIEQTMRLGHMMRPDTVIKPFKHYKQYSTV